MRKWGNRGTTRLPLDSEWSLRRREGNESHELRDMNARNDIGVEDSAYLNEGETTKGGHDTSLS